MSEVVEATELVSLLSDVNSFMVSGRLAAEPRKTWGKNGNLIVTIKLLQNNRRRVPKETGGFEWVQDKPSDFYITVHDSEKYQLASKVMRFCHTGTYVLCKCSVKPESWRERDGSWQNRTWFTMRDLIIANNKSGAEKQNAQLAAELAEVNQMLDTATTPEAQQPQVQQEQIQQQEQQDEFPPMYDNPPEETYIDGNEVDIPF